jgi:hypothetical protein
MHADKWTRRTDVAMESGNPREGSRLSADNVQVAKGDELWRGRQAHERMNPKTQVIGGRYLTENRTRQPEMAEAKAGSSNPTSLIRQTLITL